MKINEQLFQKIINTCEESDLEEIKENIYSCGYSELQLFKKKTDGELKILAINFLYNSFSFIIDENGSVGVETDEGTFELEGDHVQSLLEKTIELQLEWIKFSKGDNSSSEKDLKDSPKNNVMNFLMGKR